MKPISSIHFASLLCVLSAIALGVIFLSQSAYLPRTTYGPILHEERSEFSHIRVRGRDSKRNLLFVTDSKIEQLQSKIDLEAPGELQVAYTKALFASLLFREPQDRMLLIGLGGGGMVRFVEQHFPKTTIEAVEIDPAVVRIAADYFETRESERVRIHTEDAFLFLDRQHELFDAIYLDAFLRPDVDRDADGKTARLKTVEFLKTMRDQLVPEGVLVCNLIAYRDTTSGDLEALREVFPTVEKFAVPETGNLAVIASRKEISLTEEEWIERARVLGEKYPFGLPLQEFSKAR